MLTTGELEQMRADQVALMPDTVTVERKTSTWDESQRRTVTTWETVYPVGPGRIAIQQAAVQVTASGEVTTIQPVMVTIPHGYTPAQGDRVTVTDPRPGVPERVWVESVETPGIHATACRMACGVTQ
ncbi:DUF6093 family protein [Brachybacterium nesterenkovii]|uniref:DUF6093 family protein n=1 Tax=Brachybacterium nesterenkovii TaxID=47847 RepID=UPI0032198CBE